MLRIVTCYVPGQLRVETVAALGLEADDCDVRLVELDPSDDRAYGFELAEQWDHAHYDGVSLAVVEPDIVVRADVIERFQNCPCEYGGFPYSWGPEVGVALGCTRFRHEFILRYPGLMNRAVFKNVSWRQFDVIVQRHLLVREHGEQPHICGATVAHLNPLKQLREDADPTPIASLPAW